VRPTTIAPPASCVTGPRVFRLRRTPALATRAPTRRRARAAQRCPRRARADRAESPDPAERRVVDPTPAPRAARRLATAEQAPVQSTAATEAASTGVIKARAAAAFQVAAARTRLPSSVVSSSPRS
jgi:hypothetical protein